MYSIGQRARPAEYAWLLIPFPSRAWREDDPGRDTPVRLKPSSWRWAKMRKKQRKSMREIAARRGALGQALNKRKERLNKSKLVSRGDPPLAAAAVFLRTLDAAAAVPPFLSSCPNVAATVHELSRSFFLLFANP